MVIGDGALRSWNLASEQFPGAIQIIDLFHAREHLRDVTKTFNGVGTQTTEAWVNACCDELDATHTIYPGTNLRLAYEFAS